MIARSILNLSRNPHKLVALGCMFAILIFVGLGCSSIHSSPEQVVKAFLEADSKGECPGKLQSFVVPEQRSIVMCGRYSNVQVKDFVLLDFLPSPYLYQQRSPPSELVQDYERNRRWVVVSGELNAIDADGVQSTWIVGTQRIDREWFVLPNTAHAWSFGDDLQTFDFPSNVVSAYMHSSGQSRCMQKIQFYVHRSERNSLSCEFVNASQIRLVDDLDTYDISSLGRWDNDTEFDRLVKGDRLIRLEGDFIHRDFGAINRWQVEVVQENGVWFILPSTGQEWKP